MNIGVVLKKYIEEKVPELKGLVFPVFTTKLNITTCTYTVSPISSGHLSQSQVEIKTIGKDYDACEKLEDEVRSVLAMEEDDPPVRRFGKDFHSEVSGGGRLFNPDAQMWELTTIYIVKWR